MAVFETLKLESQSVLKIVKVFFFLFFFLPTNTSLCASRARDGRDPGTVFLRHPDHSQRVRARTEAVTICC